MQRGCLRNVTQQKMLLTHGEEKPLGDYERNRKHVGTRLAVSNEKGIIQLSLNPSMPCFDKAQLPKCLP